MTRTYYGRENVDRPLFFYVSIGKMIWLSLISCGIFQMYWVYKNWQYVQYRDNLNIKPLWRAAFAPLFYYPLLERIKQDREAASYAHPEFSSAALAGGYLLANVVNYFIANGNEPVMMIISLFFPFFLFFLPPQKYINMTTEMRNPAHAVDYWSLGQTLCVVAGALIVGLTLSTLQLLSSLQDFR